MSDPQITICALRDVDCAFEPIAWPFAQDNRAAIEDHWASLVARQPALFNGQVLLLHRGSIEDGVFRGAYLQTDYAAFLAFRDFGFPDAGKRNCFAMAALQAADGAFLLGEMGAHTANAGAIYFAAGTPDPKDIVERRVDLSASVVRELAEETGLDAAHLAVEAGWTMVAHGPRIALMRRMRSALGWEELAGKIQAYIDGEHQPELARIHVVRRVADIQGTRMPAFQQAYLRHALERGET